VTFFEPMELDLDGELVGVAKRAKIQLMRAMLVLTVVTAACGSGDGLGLGDDAGSSGSDMAVAADLMRQWETAPDLRSAVDLSGIDLAEELDLAPHVDMTQAPTTDLSPASDLLQCIARGETCSSAGECCTAGDGCGQFSAPLGKRCCAGLGATGCSAQPSGASPCCPFVPSGPSSGTAMSCVTNSTAGIAAQCCIKITVDDPTCPGGAKRAQYRCSEANVWINGDCN
jgi:hypothetical protein